MRKRLMGMGLAITLLATATACSQPPPLQVITPAIQRLAEAPPQARVFTTLDDRHAFKASEDMVYSTADGGRTWVQAGSAGSPVNYLDFISADSGWAATSAGLRDTQDGGRTWHVTTQNGVDRVDFADSQHGWMLAKGHLVETADGGKTWESIQPCTGPTVFSLPSPQTGFLVCIAGVALGHQDKTLFRTDDGGGHWSLVSQVSDAHQLAGSIPEYGVATDLYFLPDGLHGWLSTDRNGAFATTDGGQTWHQLGLRLGADFRAIRFPTPEHGFALSNWAPGLLLETHDGGATWAQTYPDLSPAGALAILNDDTVIGAVTLQDPGAILRSEDGGRHWQQIATLGQVYVAAFRFVDAKTGWALAYPEQQNGAQLYRTTDGGKSWTGPLAGLRGLELQGISLSLVDGKTGFLADATGVLRKTTDGGNSFTALPQSLGPNGQFAFTDLRHGWKLADGQLSTTADTGETWAPVTLSLKVDQLFPVSPAYAWAVAGQQLLSTLDGGQTWTQYRLDFDVYDVVASKGKRRVWAIGNNGILVTADGGESWTQIK